MKLSMRTVILVVSTFAVATGSLGREWYTCRGLEIAPVAQLGFYHCEAELGDHSVGIATPGIGLQLLGQYEEFDLSCSKRLVDGFPVSLFGQGELLTATWATGTGRLEDDGGVMINSISDNRCRVYWRGAVGLYVQGFSGTAPIIFKSPIERFRGTNWRAVWELYWEDYSDILEAISF